MRTLRPVPTGALLLALALTLALTTFACSSGDDGRYAPPEEEGAATANGGATLPAGPAGPASPDAGAAADLPFELPEGWQETQPSSQMRLKQATIPGPGGDAELAVFFFGTGSGGGVEDNIERWIGQMEPTGEPQRDSFESGQYRVSWVEVDGTLKAGTMGGPAEAQPGSTLLGAVVEGPGGPWFFKATGPEATLEAERDAFLGMLRDLG